MLNSYYLGLFLKGLVMGACDVVPGVSGGTVAFVTGIYEKLISSLTLLRPSLLIELKEKGLAFAWKKIDGNFLTSLGLGIVVGLITFAKLITLLLVQYPPVIWSLFFSLVLFSAFSMLTKIKSWNYKSIAFLLSGSLFGYFITVLAPSSGSSSYIFIFFSGFIAICAMILPGISGSFILLLLGQYVFIIKSLLQFDLPVILTFGTGCLLGLLLFSHILKWLFAHHHDQAFCLLTGIMFGSLNKLWPWKNPLSYVINRHGNKIPALQENLMPSSYGKILSLDPMLKSSLLAMALGFLFVFIFNQIGKKNAH